MKPASTQPMGILFDATLCTGCHECVAACIEKQGFDENPDEVEELSATAYTAVAEHGDHWERRMCRHCVDPSCVSVCAVEALKKTELGPVVYDPTTCMGCRYCMMACPYEVPRYEWDKPAPILHKCDMCHDRLERGEPTACAEACFIGATVSGPRDDLIAEARARIAAHPDAYDHHICGAEEIGGTSVLILLPAGAIHDHCNAELGDGALPALTWEVLEKLPPIAISGACALAAFAWIVRRRNAGFERAAQRGQLNHA